MFLDRIAQSFREDIEELKEEIKALDSKSSSCLFALREKEGLLNALENRLDTNAPLPPLAPGFGCIADTVPVLDEVIKEARDDYEALPYLLSLRARLEALNEGKRREFEEHEAERPVLHNDDKPY